MKIGLKVDYGPKPLLEVFASLICGKSNTAAVTDYVREQASIKFENMIPISF